MNGEDMTEFIVLPGSGGSGETHWQTLWETNNPDMRRFRPTDWDRPNLEDWMSALDGAVSDATETPVLVAHSLACLLVAHWQSRSSLPVAGAFMVAVPDPESEVFPSEAGGFDAPPQTKFRFPSLIAASTNDPYGTIDYVRRRADQWGSGFIEIGPLGHVNGASGLADWPQGKALLTAFTAGIARP